MLTLFTALTRERPVMPAQDWPADEPIRRFVETLELLERRRARPGGGRVRALDLFAPATAQRSDP